MLTHATVKPSDPSHADDFSQPSWPPWQSGHKPCRFRNSEYNHGRAHGDALGLEVAGFIRYKLGRDSLCLAQTFALCVIMTRSLARPRRYIRISYTVIPYSRLMQMHGGKRYLEDRHHAVDVTKSPQSKSPQTHAEWAR